MSKAAPPFRVVAVKDPGANDGARAMQVLYEVVNGPPEFADVDRLDLSKDQALAEHAAKVNALIRQNLDAQSIWSFIYLAGRFVEQQNVKRSARHRHWSNADAKDKVFSWCDANMHRFDSLNDAAMDIAETFVPQKFSTVRAWLTEWKKLRSARRP